MTEDDHPNDTKRVFICYRTKDAGHAASRLNGELTRRLSNCRVFIDHVNIQGSTPWKPVLREEATSADVLLALIGPCWHRLHDEDTGVRLLDQPNDWVRQELEIALEAGVTVLPVFVDEARLFSEKVAGSLPETVRSLADVQALRLRRLDWEADLLALLAWFEDRDFETRGPDDLGCSAAAGDELSGDLERYLRRIGAHHSKTALVGFETRLRVPISLEDIYVPLHAHCDVGGLKRGSFGSAEEAAEEQAKAESCREVALSDVFGTTGPWSRRRGLVILGDPGAGKTTHLKRLLLWVVRDGPTALGLPAGMVPVLLPLRDLRNLHSGLDEFAQDVLSAPHLDVPHDFGRRLLDRGNLLFLLDGLDEVASLDERISVSEWIREAAAVHDTCRFVVTCRYAGYRQEIDLGAEFLELHLRPLEREQSEEFIRAWFDVVETSLADDPEEAAFLGRDRAEELIGRLAEPAFCSRRMRGLTRNPLLLTAVCLVHRDRGKLPHRRAELYDECVNVLLELWRDAKQLGVHFPARDARRVLQPVALALHEEEGRTRATADEVAPALEAGLASVKRREVSPHAFLENIRVESGLLTGWSDHSFGFLHLGFQEYLAALEIRDRTWVGGDELETLAARFGESWWREVTLLLLALEGPPLFEPLMRAVFAGDSVLHHTDLLDECIEDAVEVSAGPFVEILDEKPGKKRSFWALQRLALNALERVAPERVEGLEAVLRSHPSPEISQRLDDLRRGATESVGTARRGGYELILVPGGEFQMGSPEKEMGRTDDEGPIHRVMMRPFFLGRCPVTNEEYERFLVANPGTEEPKYWSDRQYNLPRHPVVGVSWDEARDYCEWAGLRLPSEAEWEYACRGGTASRFWSGDDGEDLARVGWYAENSGGRLRPVGEKPSNPFGLRDMHGNIFEWCEDAWQDSYGGAAEDGSAWLQVGTPGRVSRGGGWLDSAVCCRSAYRDWRHPSNRPRTLGFRPALNLPGNP